jgi:hypothetical protein
MCAAFYNVCEKWQGKSAPAGRAGKLLTPFEHRHIIAPLKVLLTKAPVPYESP